MRDSGMIDQMDIRVRAPAKPPSATVRILINGVIYNSLEGNKSSSTLSAERITQRLRIPGNRRTDNDLCSFCFRPEPHRTLYYLHLFVKAKRLPRALVN